MATGPCQAGFAETHNYIYLGGGIVAVFLSSSFPRTLASLSFPFLMARKGKGGLLRTLIVRRWRGTLDCQILNRS
jgi:hypothetical protein